MTHAGRADEAIPLLQKSDELDPQEMACQTLAAIFGTKGQQEESERYWRRATELDPDRIDFWSKLEVVLFGRGKLKEADEARAHVYFLEDLYQN